MNDCFESVRLIQRWYWNFSDGLLNYIQACIFSRLKLCFNFRVKRTVRRQDFGAKFNLTYDNRAPVADILDSFLELSKLPLNCFHYQQVDNVEVLPLLTRWLLGKLKNQSFPNRSLNDYHSCFKVVILRQIRYNIVSSN